MPANAHRKRLSPRELGFVKAYVKVHAIGEAVALALPDLPDHRRETVGRHLFSLARVRAAIDRRVAKRVAGPLEVLGEISEVATAPFDKFLQIHRDANGEVVDAKVILGDKLRALEMLGKHHGVLLDPLQRNLARLVGLEVEELEGAIMARRRAEARRSLVAKSPQIIDIQAHSLPPSTSVRLEQEVLGESALPDDPTPSVNSASPGDEAQPGDEQPDLDSAPYPGPAIDLEDPKA